MAFLVSEERHALGDFATKVILFSIGIRKI